MEKDTILCPWKGEDGKVCQFRLQSQFKFCPVCGTDVNPAWFQQGKYEHTYSEASCSTRPNWVKEIDISHFVPSCIRKKTQVIGIYSLDGWRNCSL